MEIIRKKPIGTWQSYLITKVSKNMSKAYTRWQKKVVNNSEDFLITYGSETVIRVTWMNAARFPCWGLVYCLQPQYVDQKYFESISGHKIRASVREKIKRR